MNVLQLDLRYALRQMARNPWLTLVIVLTLALGIGANTTIFSLTNSVLLRPLPYDDADRLLQLRYEMASEDTDAQTFSVPELFEYRRQSRTLQSLSEYHSMSFILLGWGEPERVRTGVVSAEFFDTMGIKPYLGRTFQPGEDRPEAPRALVLSYDLWQRHFRGDPAAIGKVLQMNGFSLTVVGVLPPLPQYPGEDDVYITLQSCPFRSSEQLATSRRARPLTLLGRLEPGGTLEQAQTEMGTISRRLRQELPEHYSGVRTTDVTLVPIQELLVAEIRPTLFILLATVGLVLLTACANLANLTLARLIRREREIVLRVAIGAGRGRLVRQLLTESVLLSLLGGCLGLVLAAASSGVLAAFARLFTTRAQAIEIDASVLVFTLLVSVLTGIGVGLVPALQMTRSSLVASLKEGGTSTLGATRHRFRSALIVAQVALSFVLLTGAGLMVRSLYELQGVAGGYDPANVLSLRVPLPFTKYGAEEGLRFFQRLLEEIRRHPGVRSAAAATSFPLQGDRSSRPIHVEGQSLGPQEEPPEADFWMVSPDYFKTLGIPLLEGRAFAETDTDTGPPVAVISQSLARRAWPGQSAIGRQITTPSIANGMGITVIGVVDDVRQEGLKIEPKDTFYLSYLQTGAMEMSVLVRTDGDPLTLTNDIRRMVHALDAEQPVADVQTLADLRSRSLAPSRLTAGLLVAFALLGFAITAIGLSGVVAFVVGQRTPEIGLRMALGAEPLNVLGMLLRQGMLLVVVGLVLGIFAAFNFVKLLASQLYGVAPSDLITFVAVFCLLLLVALVACSIPARRATKIDPLIALRSS